MKHLLIQRKPEEIKLELEEFRVAGRIFGKAIEWLPKILKVFQPFRPDAKYFEINYKLKTALIKYSLSIPQNLRRKFGKIEIPKFENFKIESLIDESFNDLRKIINIDKKGGSLIIKTNKLPNCKSFLITLNGVINRDFINRLIKIKPAINKDNTITYDKYWLDVMIRDVSILEKMYNSLEINEIDCFVKVNIEKYFFTDIPKPLSDAVNTLNEFILAGKGSDRHKLFQKWKKFRIASRKWDITDLEKTIKRLSSKILVKDFIKLDDPFYLGEIKNPNKEKVIPSHFTVEALTNLTLDNPVANGYLKFHKKKYQTKVKEEMTFDLDKYRLPKK